MLILSLIFGCDDHEFTGGGHHSGGETTGEGYTAVQSVFANNCTNCHATGATFPSLDGDLCTDLVDVDDGEMMCAHAGLVTTGKQAHAGTPITSSSESIQLT